MHFTDPTGLDGWGNDVADAADAQINVLRSYLKGDVQDWEWNGTVDTLADLSSLVVDPLRVGSGLGDAIYSPDLTPTQRALSVATDVGRAAAIAAPAVSGLGRARYFFPRFGVSPTPGVTPLVKVCPNPFGKLGSPAHQAKVAEIAKDLRARGLEPVTEFRISTPGGVKSNRYADVVGLDKDGKIVEIHQVGRRNKNGSPVARERKAIDDIRRAKGIEPKFHEY